MIGGSDLKEKLKNIWSRAAPGFRVAGKLLASALLTMGKYLDDLLLICGGICFVAAADRLIGGAWALVVAGVCLVAYAVVIARSRRGGGS